MEWLRAGVKRFQQEVFAERQAKYEKVAHSQSPHLLFITCADSRIDPELLTGSEPGQMFVARNPGAMVPVYDAAVAAGMHASIEYALVVLEVRHIIVCGHSNCGAINGMLYPERVVGVPAVQRWLKYGAGARARLQAEEPFASEAARLARLTQLNVLEQMAHLETHPAVAALQSQGQLNIVGWVYEIHTGRVERYDAPQDKFLPWPE